MNLVEIKNDQPVTTSLQVAEDFEKQHKDVLGAIDTKIQSAENSAHYKNMFSLGDYKDSRGRKQRMYYMNKDGWAFIVMGFNGQKADRFKLQYIEQFNEMEKALTQPKLPTNYKEALIRLVEQVEVTEQLQLENKQLKPKAHKYDAYIESEGLVTASIIAKNYGMCARKFNELLHELGIQYKQKNTWLLYAKYQDKGYTHVSQFSYEDSEGLSKVRTTTKWTARGHMFLYDLLREHGYYPNIELADDSYKTLERRA